MSLSERIWRDDTLWPTNRAVLLAVYESLLARQEAELAAGAAPSSASGDA
jgi:hypothetical protein